MCSFSYFNILPIIILFLLGPFFSVSFPFIFLVFFVTFVIFLSPSIVVTDPDSACEPLILKLGFGGLPPALSPCVYFAASPPRSLSMTPGDD